MYKYFLFLFLGVQALTAQKRTFKCEKIHDAVKLIDEQKYDEGIAILRECEKIDPKDHSYPYEIALAYTYKKDYKNAIDQLEKIKYYEHLEDDYFQLLGNNYDYIGDVNKAIKTYDEGLKKFPNSGRLYLEKGVIYEFDKKYSKAIKSFESGIQVDPRFASNYYRISKIYLNSNDKLSGLLYGEIFMNLERTSERTQEMSKLLYDGYKKSINLGTDEKKGIEFCDIIIDTQKYEKNKKFPFCMIFGKNFILSIIDQKEFNLDNLALIRARFLKEYYKEDYKTYPNVLIEYHKKMEDNGIFNAYNHYLFQVGDTQAFIQWKKNNLSEYNKFVKWYTDKENTIKIDQSNLFISDGIK